MDSSYNKSEEYAHEQSYADEVNEAVGNTTTETQICHNISEQLQSNPAYEEDGQIKEELCIIQSHIAELSS